MSTIYSNSNGTLFNETNLSSPTEELVQNGEYSNWETLEKDYYQLFNDLKNKNVIRYSQLKKNNIVIHSWSLQK